MPADSDSNLKSPAWSIWGAATSFYFLRVILFVAFGVFGAKIQSALSIGAGAFGGLGGVAYTVYGVLQLPLGLMLDRLGHRSVLTLSCGVCVVGAAAFALSTNVYWAVLGSLLIGGGAAVAYVGAMSISRRCFSPTRFAYVVGLIILVGSLGGAATQELFAVLVKWAGWRSVMMALACFGALVMAILWLVIPDYTGKGESEAPAAAPKGFATLYRDLRSVLSYRQIWLAGIYRGFTLGQMLSFGYVWDIPFQMAHYNDFSKSVAVNTAVLIGFGLGSASIGWISDRVRRRIWPMRVTAVSMMAFMGYLIWHPTSGEWVDAALLLGFGFSCGGAALGHAMGAESSPKHLTATALALVSTIAYVISGVLQIMPGVLLDSTPAYNHPAGMVCHYTIGQYCDSFVVFPIASLCALIATFALRESFPRE